MLKRLSPGTPSTFGGPVHWAEIVCPGGQFVWCFAGGLQEVGSCLITTLSRTMSHVTLGFGMIWHSECLRLFKKHIETCCLCDSSRLNHPPEQRAWFWRRQSMHTVVSWVQLAMWRCHYCFGNWCVCICLHTPCGGLVERSKTHLSSSVSRLGAAWMKQELCMDRSLLARLSKL
jgi:hypothetical protein